MKPVDVVFKKVQVTGFDPRAETITFRVIINDGKDKAVQRTEKLENCTELAQSIFMEVRQKMKLIHKSNAFDEGPLTNVVMVRIAQDEEVVLERLAKFFASIKEKLRNAKLKKMSYFDMERQILGLTTDLG